MNSISIKRLGLALGITAALLYLGCVIFMAIVGREGSIVLFNSILHGLDTSLIIRTNIPFWEVLIGLAETFIIGYLVGASIALIYNITPAKRN